MHSLPSQRFSKTLSYVLYDGGCRLFRIYVDKEDGIATTGPAEDIPSLRKSIMQLLHGLQEVGLGGDQAQKAFAHAMDRLMSSFIVSHYMKVDWYARKSVGQHLRQWVKDGFSPLVRQVIDCLKDESGSIQTTEVQQWQDMAIGRLGRARVENLFDFIINWDRSLGAILDIKVRFFEEDLDTIVFGIVLDSFFKCVLVYLTGPIYADYAPRNTSKLQLPKYTFLQASRNKYRGDFYTLGPLLLISLMSTSTLSAPSMNSNRRESFLSVLHAQSDGI